jgi:Zn-dependent protease
MSQSEPPPPRVMPARGVRLATINHVPIYVSPISLIFLIFMGVIFDGLARNRLFGISDSRAYTLGAVLSVITLLSIVLHEIGHSLVAQALRFNVKAISIFGFVGVTEFEPQPQTPARAFLVSVAGSLVNLAIGIPALFWYFATDEFSTVGVLAFGVTYINILLGLFNLLPGLPLDGGAAFAAVVWKVTGDREQANRVAAYGGFVVAGGLAIWGLTSPGGAGGYTLGFAALIALGAGQSLKSGKVIAKLPSLFAGQVQRRAVTVEANLPLAEALRRAEVLGVTAVIVNDSSGRPWALMNGAAADAVPVERRPWTTINQVSRPIEDGMRIPESLGGQELMDRLQTTPASEYLVYGPDDQPTGVLVMVDVVARIDPAAAARLASRR